MFINISIYHVLYVSTCIQKNVHNLWSFEWDFKQRSCVSMLNTVKEPDMLFRKKFHVYAEGKWNGLRISISANQPGYWVNLYKSSSPGYSKPLLTPPIQYTGKKSELISQIPHLILIVATGKITQIEASWNHFSSALMFSSWNEVITIARNYDSCLVLMGQTR